jgi:hypothetical protein
MIRFIYCTALQTSLTAQSSDMSKRRVWGPCRLCRSEDWLVDSHIIPNYHYKPLKESDGYYYVMSSDPATKVRREQKGVTEPLFCAQCDNARLGRNESHLARVIFGGHLLEGERDGPFWSVKGYDYKKVKNALLSILWRMSVSTHPYFAEVDLGKRHDEFIRMGLLNDMEFREEQYPVLLAAPSFRGGDLGQLILPPEFTRTEGNHVYRCLISGLVFTFVVGSAAPSAAVKHLMLRRDGWRLVKARIEQIPFVFDACFQIAQAETLRHEQLA